METPIARCNRTDFRSKGNLAMNAVRTWLHTIALAALSVGSHSQSADTSTSPLSNSSPHEEAPSPATLSNGSGKTIQLAYGPYVTGVGTGCSAANVSELGPGLVTFGWSAKTGADSVA